MAYTPINWQTGDTITAEKLNRCDNGWSVTSSASTLFNDSVTTYQDGSDNAAELNIGISAETITVTYDGVAYSCTNDGGMYGAPYEDYSTYPFTLYNDGFMLCETAGTHTVKVEAVTTTAEASDSFAVAVATFVPLLKIVQNHTTWQQVYDAMAAGKIAYYFYDNGDSASTYFAEDAHFDDSSSRYRVSCNGGSMTLYADSASGALMAV